MKKKKWIPMIVCGAFLLVGCGKWPPVTNTAKDVLRLPESTENIRARALHDEDFESLRHLQRLNYLDLYSGWKVVDAGFSDRGLATLASLNLLHLETMSSGQFQGQEKISKKGNALLRYALCHAVNVALAKNKDLQEIFQQKLKVLGNTKKAKAKLKIKFVAKYIRVAFALLKNNTTFDINRFKALVEDPVLTT